MKSLIIITFLLTTIIAFSQQPTVRFELQDGSSRSYILEEIKDLSFETANQHLILQLFQKDQLSLSLLLHSVDSVSFGKDIDNNDIMTVYAIDGAYTYMLNQVDSILFAETTSQPAVISEITPDAALIGEEVTIHGEEFGENQEASKIAFQGKNADEISLWSDTKLIVKVPLGAQNGNLSIIKDGLKSNGLYFKVIPQISSLSKNSGYTGDTLKISGKGFGYTQGTSLLYCNKVEVKDIIKWVETQIIILLPHGEPTGSIFVVKEEQKSNELTFSLLPRIDAIKPAAARIYDTVTVTGSSFSSKQDSNYISFAGKKAIYYPIWSDTLIKVIVPMGAKTGKASILVNNKKSSEFDFAIKPNIIKLFPDTAGVTEQVTLSGTGFGPAQGSSVVTFNTVSSEQYLSWTDTSITCIVPPNAKSCRLTVRSGNERSNEVNFTIKQMITQINPMFAKIGDIITITGTDLGTDASGGKVYLNDVLVSEISGWTEKEVKFKVPDSAYTGPVRIRMNNCYSNPMGLIILPTVKEVNPASSRLGQTITVKGNGFGLVKGTSDLLFNNVPAGEISSWDRFSIVAKVPAGARTGKVAVRMGTDKSNEADFTVLPTITYILPVAVNYGDIVTINGASFGAEQGSGTVSFAGTIAGNYTSWADEKIQVAVPSGAISGKLVVTVNSVNTNEVDFSLKPNITNISPDNGTANDFITITGTNFGSTRGTSTVTFYNNKVASNYQSWSNTQIVVKVPGGTKTGAISVTVNNLVSNTVTFTINAGSYEEVAIGTQTWMLKNLDVTTYRNGDPIPEVTDATEWRNLTTGAWCYYNNDPANGETYGKLYNWYAVNDSRGLAPQGWHIPDTTEANILIEYLGGKNDGGGKMKETGTTHWASPNTGATNESGFTALGAGERHYSGNYLCLYEGSLWWLSTEMGNQTGGRLDNWHDSAYVNVYSLIKNIGASVRCIKD